MPPARSRPGLGASPPTGARGSSPARRRRWWSPRSELRKTKPREAAQRDNAAWCGSTWPGSRSASTCCGGVGGGAKPAWAGIRGKSHARMRTGDLYFAWGYAGGRAPTGTLDHLRDKELIHVSTNTIASKDGTKIAYDRTGEGPAVILVHPAFGHRMGNPEFAELARLLSSFGYSVYSYDRRGRGESGDTPPYPVQQEIADLAAVISAAGGAAGGYRVSSGAALAPPAGNNGGPVTPLGPFPPSPIPGGSPRTVPASFLPPLAAPK